MAESKIREARVAGQFYLPTAQGLKRQVESLINQDIQKKDALACMLPHAGYQYSGRVAGEIKFTWACHRGYFIVCDFYNAVQSCVSDIDVAVVFDQADKDLDKYRFLLWNLRMSVDMRIEPHGFLAKDFYQGADPVAYEIKKTGVRVA